MRKCSLLYVYTTGFDYYFGICYSNDMGSTDKPGLDLPSCPPCVHSQYTTRCVLLSRSSLSQNTHQVPYSLRFCVRFICLLKYVKSSLNRKHEECYTEVALPLFENETIIEQPLDTWSLKNRYASAAVKQIFTTRCVHHFCDYTHIFYLI